MTVGRLHLCALALAATALLATAAAASGGGPSQPTKVTQPTTVTTFATGLTNPRHVRFGPDGNLYVAEAGVGGTEPAVATPGCDLVDNMFSQDGPYKPGFTGRISRILPDGTRQTVATGLPSVVDNFGDSLGPSDLAWLGGTMYVTLEGGGCSRGTSRSPSRDRAGQRGRHVGDRGRRERVRPREPRRERARCAGPTETASPTACPTRSSRTGATCTSSRRTTTPCCASTRRRGRSLACMTCRCRIPRRSCLPARETRTTSAGSTASSRRSDTDFGAIQTFDEGFGPIVELEFAKGRLHVLETFGADTPWTPETGRVIRLETRRNPDDHR